jgi:hypothetical protein
LAHGLHDGAQVPIRGRIDKVQVMQKVFARAIMAACILFTGAAQAAK